MDIVPLRIPPDGNLILGQSCFIKTMFSATASPVFRCCGVVSPVKTWTCAKKLMFSLQEPATFGRSATAYAGAQRLLAPPLVTISPPRIWARRATASPAPCSP